MKTIILDFDNVINNEDQDLLETLKEFNEELAFSLMIKLKLNDLEYGHLEWDEIIRKTAKDFNINIDPEKFEEIYENKLQPNEEITKTINMLNEKCRFIIFSKNSEDTIKRFLQKFSLNKYINKIYAHQKKYLKNAFLELIKKEKLVKEETLFIGDKVIDVLIPKMLGFKTIIWNPMISNISIFDEIKKFCEYE